VFWRCGKLQVEFNIPLSEQLDDLAQRYAGCGACQLPAFAMSLYFFMPWTL